MSKKHTGGLIARSPEAVFWAQVITHSNPDQCWGWTGKPSRHGYGRVFYRKDGRSIEAVASRVSYQIHKGEIPEGLFVLHSCRSRICTNPRHLRVGTQQENMDDKKKDGTTNEGERGGNAKLTRDDVAAIHWAAEVTNLTRTAIGPHFGIDGSTVCDILRGKCWKHLQIPKLHPPAWNSKLKTNCIRGHPYNDRNTGRKPNGHRYCLECHRVLLRAKYAAKKSLIQKEIR